MILLILESGLNQTKYFSVEVKEITVILQDDAYLTLLLQKEN